MKWHIDFEIPKAVFQIEATHKIAFMGSCFSDEIAQRMTTHSFDVVQNPFGTIFHPLAISRLFCQLCNETQIPTVVKHQDVYFVEEAAGTLFGYSEDEVLKEYKNRQSLFKQELEKADVLIITFGTSIGYRSKLTNQVVANCHKQSSNSFDKEFTPLQELITEWNDIINLLNQRFPQLKVLFTISPVKHLREGVVENVRSKARLIELVYALNQAYFPSFEIVQEYLRDYRFYKLDGAHPNDLAIDEVYQIFVQTYFSEQAKNFVKDMEKLNQLKRHHILYENSMHAQEYRTKLEEFSNNLKTKHSFASKRF